VIKDYILVREVKDICPCDSVSIDKYHRKKGLLKIGYHFVITEEGVVQKGRELEMAGAHTRGFNDCSIGIGLCGSPPNPTQLGALQTLIMILKLQYQDIEVINSQEEQEFDTELWWDTLNQI